MTGDEIKAARTGCKMSREDLGAMLGVSAQTIGAWERIGPKHLAMSQPRESPATAAAKAKLPTAMHFMQAAGVLHLPTSELVPCPCDWLPILRRGDPLVLSDDEAVEGDLVLLRGGDNNLSAIARVEIERDAGKLLCFTRPYQLQVLPGPDGYKVIKHAICTLHDGVPDTASWTQVVPPYMV